MLHAKIGPLDREEPGILMHTFRRRFMLLDGAALHCLAQPPNMAPEGRLVLHKSGVVVQRLENEHAVLLTDSYAQTMHKLTAESAEEIADWIRALELALGGQESSVLKMGFLRRELVSSRWWSNARRQWCVVDSGVLFAFKRPPEFSPVAVLPLDRSLQISVGEVHPDGSADFELAVAVGLTAVPPSSSKLAPNPSWRLRAANEAMRSDWLDAINHAVSLLPAPTASVSVMLEKKGWLQKLSGGLADSGLFATFSPRFVVVTGGAVLYFARPGDSDARGCFKLVERDAQASVNRPIPSAPSEFSITAPLGSRTFLFRADGADDATAWCDFFDEAIQGQLKLTASMGASSMHSSAAPTPDAARLQLMGQDRLHTLFISAPGAAPASGPCITAAVFDLDDAEGHTEGAPAQQDAAHHEACARGSTCGTPQAVRWQCNARLVGSFEVIWRRYPAVGVNQLVPSHRDSESIQVHKEIVGVSSAPDTASSTAMPNDNAPLMVDCYSAYLPSIDDVGSRLLVEYIPQPLAVFPFGTPGSAVHDKQWAGSVCISRSVVQPNPTVAQQVDASVSRGSAEFLVVAQWSWSPGSDPEDVWCELRISDEGVRLRSLRGGRPLFTLARHGVGVKQLEYPAEGEVAEVVLPSETLQVCLFGANESSIVVQAESPYMRDSIASVARQFEERKRNLQARH